MVRRYAHLAADHLAPFADRLSVLSVPGRESLATPLSRLFKAQFGHTQSDLDTMWAQWRGALSRLPRPVSPLPNPCTPREPCVERVARRWRNRPLGALTGRVPRRHRSDSIHGASASG